MNKLVKPFFSVNIILFSIIFSTAKCEQPTSRQILANNILLCKNSPVWKLAQYVEAQDTTKIKNFCREHSNLINYQESKFKITLLHWVVYNGKFHAVKALVKEKADPNIRDSSGISAFMQSAFNYQTSECLRLLLNCGGNVNSVSYKPDNVFGTPLITASQCRLESVKILLDAGAKINFTTEDGNCALISACNSEKIEIVKYLIVEKGADFTLKAYKRIDGSQIYIVDLFRNMLFPLNSQEYKTKMEVVEFMKNKGVNYWNTKIPGQYLDKYDSTYLSKY